MTLKLSVRVGIFCICYAMLCRERALLFLFPLCYTWNSSHLSLRKGSEGVSGAGENKSGREGGGRDGGSNALIQMLPEDLRIPWKEIWGKKRGGWVRKWRQPGRNCFPVLGRNLRIWSPACFNEDTGNCHRGVKPQVVLSFFFLNLSYILSDAKQLISIFETAGFGKKENKINKAIR